MLNAVLEALKHNTKVEALYIQNFEDGFFDEQLEKLTEVLKLKRIWCLNVGENFRTTLPAWRAFAEELPETAVSHMYASEHHFIGTDLKNQMKDAIRETRKANVIPHSLEVIMSCGNMWYNPKLPKWAREMKGGATALLARQQAASADSSVCALHGGVKGEHGRGEGARLAAGAAADIEKFARDRRSVRRNGKRTVVQTAKGAAFATEASAKQRRKEHLKRERIAERRREEADAALAERNAPRVVAALKARGGAAAVGWKVRVYWPDEEAWFHGTITAFDAGSGRHSVKYDDDDEQDITLGKSSEKVGFLRAPRGFSAANDKKSPGDAGAASGCKVKPAAPAPTRKSGRTRKKRAESPPPPPGGLRGSHGIRAAAAARRLQAAIDSAPKRKRSSLGAPR